MQAYTERKDENRSRGPGADSQSASAQEAVPFADNRPEAGQTAQLQAMANGHAAAQPEIVQRRENNTGLPADLESGFAALTDYDFSDVTVHRNSPEPAKLGALAYTQGTDIHLGPRQERHLPHEAWHVVQQKQERVKSTTQLKGVGLNDDSALEREADRMGERARQGSATPGANDVLSACQQSSGGLNTAISGEAPVQRKKINLGVHGEAVIPNDIDPELVPDIPIYGPYMDVGNLGLAAQSMKVLLTPNHAMGESPKKLVELMKNFPTIGNYRDIWSPKGTEIYIRGHLLNDNLGGPGEAKNLFPITHSANVDHERKVEGPLKNFVNKKGGIAEYSVEVKNVKVDEAGEEGGVMIGEDLFSTVDADFFINVKQFKNGKTIKSSNVINSRWNTNKPSESKIKTINNINGYSRANKFDVSRVNTKRRGSDIEFDLDISYLEIAKQLARTFPKSPKNVNDFLQDIKGIGPKGAHLLLEKTSWQLAKGKYSKNERSTLKRAYNALKTKIDDEYGFYQDALRYALRKYEETNDVSFSEAAVSARQGIRYMDVIHGGIDRINKDIDDRKTYTGAASATARKYSSDAGDKIKRFRSSSWEALKNVNPFKKRRR